MTRSRSHGGQPGRSSATSWRKGFTPSCTRAWRWTRRLPVTGGSSLRRGAASSKGVVTRAESAPLENHGYGVHRGQMVHSVKWAHEVPADDPARPVRAVRPAVARGSRRLAAAGGEDRRGLRRRGPRGSWDWRLPGGSTTRRRGILPAGARRCRSGTAGAVTIPRFETMNQMPELARRPGRTPCSQG